MFHVGTGLRATPPRHFDKVRSLKVAKVFADDLDSYDPVGVDGTLRVGRDEYHRHVDAFLNAM